MHKETVTQEASDRKQNRCMPKKRGFQAPKRNSSSLSVNHFDRTDLFLTVANREHMCLLIPGSKRHAASPASCSETHDRPSTYNLQKIILLYSSNALFGKREYLYWFMKTFPPQNSGKLPK